MRITGGCHCADISYELDWQGSRTQIPVRECGCTFCRKHGGAWTSDRTSELRATIAKGSKLRPYSFETSTAQFYVCPRCGVVPFVISAIDARLYAVVNTNTFEDREGLAFNRSAADFDGEDLVGRLDRRERNWIPNVSVTHTAG